LAIAGVPVRWRPGAGCYCAGGRALAVSAGWRFSLQPHTRPLGHHQDTKTPRETLSRKTLTGLVCSRLSGNCQSPDRRWHATSHCWANRATVPEKHFVSWCLGGQSIALGR